MTQDFKLGITQEFPCNYLSNKNERLLIAVDERFHDQSHYNWLMHQGFRRSGDQIYRPHCQACTACHSLRVMCELFTPSKSQKRLLKKNAQFNIKISDTVQDNYYPLYEQYINTIHSDGAMYPATKEQFAGFVNCTVCPVRYIEIWDSNKLISVAVTDELKDGLSAVYTFYDPTYRQSGLGVYSILKQIETSVNLQKPFLYLGYQIDDCKKMNYKNKYFPHQRLINQTWQIINK
ncbi:arginyltransferase [Thalassotalea atypica]|uniref:arginyltransferase n=1 Tax=Thalassotalea atypica TaxID=2054316 RepID=UPI002572AD91|nr:arginyltransferase [Thalassotalea atypica]